MVSDANLDDSHAMGPRERLAENIRVLRAQVEGRATGPGGQELPEWITYVPYETTIDGVPLATGSLVELPLTYYGPSIPLAQGWTYGGSTSPALPASSASATSATAGSSERSSLATTTGSGTRSSTRSSRSSDRTSSRSNTRTSTASEATTSATSTSSASTSMTRSSSTPTTSSPSLSSSSTTLPSSSSSSIPQSLSSSTSPTATSTSTLGAVPASSHRNLLAPLLGTLIPLALSLLILLILLYLWRKKRPNKDVGFWPWLSTPREWAAVPVVFPDTASKERKGESPAMLPPGLRSPNEKSALLPDFMAQHHRNSSSISSAIAPPRPSTSVAEHSPEMKDLVQQNQSLLQRLTLGLGWAPSPSPRNSGSSEGERKTSGNTAERGENPGSEAGMGGRMVSGAMAGAMAAAGVFGVRRERSTAGLTASSSGNDTPGQKYERVLDDDQLFYRVPPQTSSSKGSNNGSSSRSRPSTGGNQWNRQQPSLPEGSSSGHETRPSMTFSVSVPETPGSRHLSERDMDVAEFGRNIAVPQISPSKVRPASGEREHMRFPIPPGLALAMKKQPKSNSSFADVGKDKESRTSTETFYSALTGRPAPSSPGSAESPPQPQGSPIHRENEDYRHASVSVFGSVPTTPVPTEWEGTGSSQSHAGQPNSQTGALSRDTSPHKSLYAPSPVSPAMIATARRSQVTPVGDDAIRPMKRLFGLSATPRSSMESRESQLGKEERENSWAGEPLIDERAMMAPGNLGGRERGRGMVGEFGEGLKSVYVAGASRTQQAPFRHSQQGSIHTTNLSSNPSSVAPAYPTGSSYHPSPLSPHAPKSPHSTKSQSSLTHSLSITSTSASGSSSGHSVTHSTQGQGVRGKRSAALLVPAGAVISGGMRSGVSGDVPPVPPAPAPMPIVVSAQDFNEKEKPIEEEKQKVLEQTPKKGKQIWRESPPKSVGPRPISGSGEKGTTIWGGLRR
ncbi:hypothetical protein IAR50_004291 [Cryptococcus sp. DSM 104548]